jgi:membrane protein DedA with SNARE-associated domain
MVFWPLTIGWASKFIEQFGYAAVFLISLLGTSTLFIPFPLDIIISFAFGSGLNPVLIGIFAGLGSSLGELTGYFVGLGGRSIIKEKRINAKTSKIVSFITSLFKKHGFFIIIIAAFVPFPFDVIGISAGIGNYDIKKFFVASLIGRSLRCILIAYTGYKIIPFISERIW